MSRERREFSRVPQPFDAQYRLAGELTEGWRTIKTLNLSAGGMRFKSSDLIEVGAELDIQIEIPSNPAPLALRGRVVWSQLQASGVTENGAEFLDVTPEKQMQIDTLVSFLNQAPRSGPTTA